MKGLLVRLSRTDSEAEAALRVIEYFDALTEGRATIESLVRGAAALAECPAGLSLEGRRAMRYDSRGARLDDGPVQPSSAEDVGPTGAVWLERAEGPGPLDAILVEQLALAARTLMPTGPARGGATLADVALVETVLSEREPVEERTKALRRLGLVPERPLTVIAASPVSSEADPAGEALALLSGSRVARAAHIASVDRVAAVLVQTVRRETLVEQLPSLVLQRSGDERGRVSGIRVGIGRGTSAIEAPRSWSSAVLALRFTTSRSPSHAVVDVTDLGTVAVLAEVDAPSWVDDPRVADLLTMAGSTSGEVDLLVLDAFLSTGSLRQAAALLHMHHSSVASRLARLEERLNWSFARPHDVFQAQLALFGLRLTESAADSRQPAKR